MSHIGLDLNSISCELILHIFNVYESNYIISDIEQLWKLSSCPNLQSFMNYPPQIFDILKRPEQFFSNSLSCCKSQIMLNLNFVSIITVCLVGVSFSAQISECFIFIVVFIWANMRSMRIFID